MKTLSRVYMFLVFLFLYAPIAVLVAFSFNDSATMSRSVWSGFTTKWYVLLFKDQMLLQALSNTLIIAVVAARVSTALGTSAAIGIMGMNRWIRRIVMNITNFPMVNPDIVTGVSLMLLFVAASRFMGNVSLGMASLIFSHITFCLPYVILSVMPKLRQMDPNLSEAAQDLGCTQAQAFFRVVLPQIMPGVVTGMIMAFTLSIDDFVVSYFTSGTTQTLPIYIYSMTRKRVSPEINALSALLFTIILLLLIVINVRMSRESRRSRPGRRKPEMKRIIAVMLACVLLFSSMPASAKGQASDSAQTGVTINVYNWGEYISTGKDGTMDVNGEFTKRTGIRINYTTFEDNESMYSKIAGGGANYDVIVPSDYMISKMINEKLVQKLDFDNIPNYKYIDGEYRNQAYDPKNEYSIPYAWGVTGIFYNKKYVKEKVDSWRILWDKKYSGKILMFDNPRDSFGIAQKILGYSFNSTKMDEWNAAAKLLEKQKPLVQAYVMDQIFDKMSSGEAWLAPYYAGDAVTLVHDNPDIGFAIPTKEGTNFFVDAMCVPTSAKHKKAAEEYINFLCRPDVAAANMKTVGYSTPESSARKLLPENMRDSDIFYPPENIIKNSEVYVDLPQDVSLQIDALWAQVKMGSHGQTTTLILVLAGFLLVYVAVVIFKKVKRRSEVAGPR